MEKVDCLSRIYDLIDESRIAFEEIAKEHRREVRALLFDETELDSKDSVLTKGNTTDTPIQVKKRVKRLSSLVEAEIETSVEIGSSNISARKSARISNAKLLETADAIDQVDIKETTKDNTNFEKTSEECVMLSQHQIKNANSDQNLPLLTEQRSLRPQRAAKLKSEKNLKEPKLNVKLRRPINDVTIKLEHKERPSQMFDASKISHTRSISSKIEDSILVLPQKKTSIVEIPSDNDDDDEQSNQNVNIEHKQNSFKSNESIDSSVRQFRIRVKREKLSVCETEIAIPQTAISTETPVPPTTTGTPIETTVTEIQPVSKEKDQSADETESILNTIHSTFSSNKSKKISKKKKAVPLPIKVERLSILDNLPPSAGLRTKNSKAINLKEEKKSEDAEPSNKSTLRHNSIYEDAVNDLPETDKNQTKNCIPPITQNQTNDYGNKLVNNTTVVLSKNVAINDETFCTTNANQTTTIQADVNHATFLFNEQPNCNATITLDKQPSEKSDATFQLSSPGKSNNSDSMVTARDTLTAADNLMTEDESDTQYSMTKVKAIQPTSAKAYKMPLRSKELFNPLVQSPVKMKVKAFENASILSNGDSNKPRLRSKKENAAPSVIKSNNTPSNGRLPKPTLGRFLTPTQLTNVTSSLIANPKKAPNSTSKIQTFPKTMTNSGSSTNLKKTNSTSTKTLSRENTNEDIRKGLQHQLAEERKIQREQKHLLAAQHREAMERERMERVNKLAKEREEKRCKKLETEQKKRELEEMQRKLRQEEEATAETNRLKAAKIKAIADKERELLQIQVKKQTASAKKNMLPPPPKLRPPPTPKYNFDMLHEYDSTDDEEKVTHKRPPPPVWSRSNVRGVAILIQQQLSTSVIDSFFSVQPISPDLKEIFPNIDRRYLQRNSSVLWSTPPRYSEIQKH